MRLGHFLLRFIQFLIESEQNNKSQSAHRCGRIGDGAVPEHRQGREWVQRYFVGRSDVRRAVYLMTDVKWV